MLLSTVVSSKALAVTAGAVLAGLGSGVVAAYADVLPAPLQAVAHTTIGAPSADPSGTTPQSDPTDEPSSTEAATPSESETETADGQPTSPSATPVGPDASGPAAYGLCTAFRHGGLAQGSVAYHALVTAAGSSDAITGYCATIVKPGSPTGTPSAPDLPTDRPTDPQAQAPHGSPSSHPDGRPTDVPRGGPFAPTAG